MRFRSIPPFLRNAHGKNSLLRSLLIFKAIVELQDAGFFKHGFVAEHVLIGGLVAIGALDDSDRTAARVDQECTLQLAGQN